MRPGPQALWGQEATPRDVPGSSCSEHRADTAETPASCWKPSRAKSSCAPLNPAFDGTVRNRRHSGSPTHSNVPRVRMDPAWVRLDLTVWRRVRRQEHGSTAQGGVPYVANPNLSEVRATRWPRQVEPALGAQVLLEPGQNTALARRLPRGPDGQAGQQEALGSRVRD